MNIILFNFLFLLHSNQAISQLALFLSYPFTYAILFALIVWAIFFSKRKMYNFSLLFLSVSLSWIFADILKNILKTERPFHTLNIVPLYQETGFSFPSEHMTVFTAIAVSMFFIDKRAGLIFSIIAILIGVSRVIIGVHYPFDIVGGFAVGLVVSFFINKIFKKI